MNPPTVVLNEKLIRMVKGMIKAWEQWVEDSKKPTN